MDKVGSNWATTSEIWNLMAVRGEVKAITLGGKGSSLSSSSVYAVASGHAQLCNDSSALDRLLSDQNPSTSLKSFQIPFPNSSTPLRASLTFLLNKLLLYSNNSTNIRIFLPNLISKTLNSKSETGSFDSIEVTEEEHVYGVCSILDSDYEEDNGKFVHEVNALLGTVWSIVSWEGITAFVALEGGELMNAKSAEGIEANGRDEKVVKKGEKKKKTESPVRIRSCIDEYGFSQYPFRIWLSYCLNTHFKWFLSRERKQ